jgi:3-hydroxyisobutyrate dehydrogenase-like beta-hydroxyacid dehydrogenase
MMTSLRNDDVVESVATGPDGLVAGLSEGKVRADLSTEPWREPQLTARVRRGGNGAQMLDTPVSGSVPQVKTGTLAIMVGGDADAFIRVESALRVLRTPVHVGGNSQGLVLKLAINISLAAQMLAFSEGLLLADRDGISPDLAAKVGTESAVGSPMLRARVPFVLGHCDETWFDVSLMHKDIRLALAAAREDHVRLPPRRSRRTFWNMPPTLATSTVTLR